MKVLLFTHKNDIDGMGSVVLAKLAYDKVDYVLCETFDINEEVNKYYESKKMYEYDKVFVTDLFINESLLEKIQGDTTLKDKFFIFDHHKTYLDISKKYPFTTVKINDEFGKTCATYIFYQYLVDNMLIDKSNSKVFEFCELTRRHDTWEWKDIYNDEKSHELALLFDSMTPNSYIDAMYDKLKDVSLAFEYNEFENLLIKTKKIKIKEKLDFYLENIYLRNILNYKAGVVFIEYEYRNELAEYIKEINFDLDFVMMIAIDRGTVSYRSIKDNINVRIVAEAFNGKGHDKASTSKIDDNYIEEIVNNLIKVKKLESVNNFV